MAKSYVKGSDYRLYLNTATYGSPTWAEIKACGDISVDIDPDDVEVPERGMATGHLKGENNPHIDFTLFEDTGDTNVETLIAAIYSGAQKELAVGRGAIGTAGTSGSGGTAGVKYLRLECNLSAPLGAARSDPSSYEVTAYRHANSDYDISRNTVS